MKVADRLWDAAMAHAAAVFSGVDDHEHMLLGVHGDAFKFNNAVVRDLASEFAVADGTQ